MLLIKNSTYSAFNYHLTLTYILNHMHIVSELSLYKWHFTALSLSDACVWTLSHYASTTADQQLPDLTTALSDRDTPWTQAEWRMQKSEEGCNIKFVKR